MAESNIPDENHVPLGPEEDHELQVRRKMPGVLRFSRKTMTIAYIVGGVFLLAVLYAMGFFGGSKKEVANIATPPPVADLSSPGPEISPNENANPNTFTAPSPPPTPYRSSTPPPAGRSQATTPRADSDLARALADASKSGSPEPLIPQSPGGSGTTPSSLPPPVAVPEPGASVGPAGTNPVTAATRTNGGQSFYVGGSNVGQSNAAALGGSTIGQSGSNGTSAGGAPIPNPGPTDRTSLQQDQRSDFSNDGQPHFAGYLDQHVEKAPSRYELWAGSTIPAQLDTGINSDLPGPAVAHVVTDVFDSRDGRYLLIPRDSRLIGHYNTSISVGQARIQILWDRLIWPDGRQIDLEGMPGADTEGNAGLFADVNNHIGRILTTTLITGLLAGAAQIGQGGQNSLVTVNPYTGQSVALQPSTTSILASNLAQSAQQTGSQLIQQAAAQPPTLTVPKGERFSVILDKTIELQPYASGNL